MSNIELPEIIGNTILLNGSTIEETAITPKGADELDCCIHTYHFYAHNIRSQTQHFLAQALRTQKKIAPEFRVPIILTATSSTDYDLFDEITDALDDSDEFFYIKDQTYIIPENYVDAPAEVTKDIAYSEGVLLKTLNRYRNSMSDAALKKILHIMCITASKYYEATLQSNIDVHLIWNPRTMWNSVYNSFYTCNTELRRFFLAALYSYTPDKQRIPMVFNTDRIVHIGVPMVVHKVNSAVNTLLGTRTTYRPVRDLPQHKNHWRMSLLSQHKTIVNRLSAGLEDGSIHVEDI